MWCIMSLVSLEVIVRRTFPVSFCIDSGYMSKISLQKFVKIQMIHKKTNPLQRASTIIQVMQNEDVINIESILKLQLLR